jgi:hypothetical protein
MEYTHLLGLNITPGHFAVLVDMEDVPRVIIKATGDNKIDMQLLEEALTVEYNGKTKFTHGVYYNSTDMYELKFDIEDMDMNVINYDFYMYKLPSLYQKGMQQKESD